MLSDVKRAVNEGRSLADSLKDHPKVFPHLYVNMVAAGESSGNLDQVFERLADFMESQVRLRAKLMGAMMYPIIMVLLGGIQTLTGPIVGASVFAVLQDTVMRQTEYWRALLGGIILVLVLAFPQGIVGAFSSLWRRSGAKP